MYYLVKLRFETENEKTGNTKAVREQYLISATSPTQAETKAKDKFAEGVSEMKVESIIESKILGVIE